MPTEVIMPALGISQDTGTLIRWLKEEGEAVTQGEPLMEIETDKATVEVECPGTGILANVTAAVGEAVPVGQVIALIAAPGDSVTDRTRVPLPVKHSVESPRSVPALVPSQQSSARSGAVAATPVATRLAAEHGLDLSVIQTAGSRITKADVLAYIQDRDIPDAQRARRLMPASPKARRLAAEQGANLAQIRGSGSGGAVLSADLMLSAEGLAPVTEPHTLALSSVWRLMAEQTTKSWTGAPHFYLVRQVNALRLVSWREQAQKIVSDEVSYTDLLIKLVAEALRSHPHLNAMWLEGTVVLNEEMNVGFAVAVEDGLVVPTIHRADRKPLSDIFRCRKELVARAREKKLRPEDISGGTFTISNLGMYGVDAFNAIINPPQAAILTIGRIAPHVVPVNGLPDVQPMMTLGLSCDHRVVDGVRGARFLQTLADLIEEPLGLVTR